MFKYYRGWQALWLAGYLFVLVVAAQNIIQGIGGGNTFQWNLGITQILLVGMFVISDLRSHIIDRQNRVLRLVRGGLR